MLAVGVFLAAAVVSADYIVFRDGRSLKVSGYRFEGDQTAVDLASGGSMRFSSQMVQYVAPNDDVEAQPPRPFVAARYLVGDSWLAYADPRYVESIRRVSNRHQLDPALVAAVVKVESGFRPHAVSPKGAKGLMQLMDVTAREHGLSNPFDVEANLEAGTAHLRELVQRYQGDLRLALAAYNAGAKRVDRARGVPKIAETQLYVSKVLGLFQGVTID